MALSVTFLSGERRPCRPRLKNNLVVCDLSMSGLDGRAVYHVIERQPPPRPAMVFLTGHAAASGPYKDFLSAAHAPVVIKPFDINVLRETVRRMLSGT